MPTSISLTHFDPRLQQGLKRITDTTPRVLLIGGCVRDALLSIPSHDLDVEVYGVAPDRLETLLQELFPGQVNAVGKAFGILKIHLAEDLEIDVSIPRRESKVSPGHRGFSVDSDPNMTIEDAARRRDFTINAIAADAKTGELIDPFNGIADLDAKLLRIVDAERFQDDPLRVYRAIQFVARLGLTCDPTTTELLKTMVERGDLAELPAERVTEEFKKLFLKSPKPSVGFELMRDLGIIDRHFPELHVLKATPQEKEWHPEGDVWIHSLMVLDQAAKLSRQPERHFTELERLEVIVGALCHDLGKPSTTKEEEGRIRSRGHEDAGKEPTQVFCAKFAFGEDVNAAAIAIAMNHLKPGMFYRAHASGELNDEQYTNAVRKLLKRIYPVSWQVLSCASEADFRGRDFPGSDGPYPTGELFARIIREHHLDEDPKKPLLQGRDLLELGVKPGAEMGALIQKIEELRDAGTITTREEALAHARLALS